MSNDERSTGDVSVYLFFFSWEIEFLKSKKLLKKVSFCFSTFVISRYGFYQKFPDRDSIIRETSTIVKPNSIDPSFSLSIYSPNRWRVDRTSVGSNVNVIRICIRTSKLPGRIASYSVLFSRESKEDGRHGGCLTDSAKGEAC